MNALLEQVRTTLPLSIFPATRTRCYRRRKVIDAAVWAERHRDLPPGQSPRPGPWRNSNAPYGVGVMQAPTLPGIRKLTIQKPAQGGFSEFVRNIVGCMATTDPDPAMLVFPTRDKGQETVQRRLLPFFRDTPALAAILGEDRSDATKSCIATTTGFLLWLAWSGSPTSLASHPVRLLINEEVDKNAMYSGREANPMALAEQRVKTYMDKSLIINISTPTTDDGVIARLVAMADIVLRYFVPCPGCGKRFELAWEQVRWPKREEIGAADDLALSRHVESEKDAWYQCPDEACRHRIRERDKPAVVRKGCWATVEQIRRGDDVDADVPMGGILMRGLERAVHVAMVIESMPFLWVRCWELAAKFLRVKPYIDLLMDFVNSDLGRVFVHQTASSHASAFAEKSQRASWPARRLPAWTGKLLMTVDVQADRLYYVVRAWGPQMRSRRIDHGLLPAATLADGLKKVRELAFATPWPFEGDAYTPILVDAVGIDCGFLPDEIYALSRHDPRVFPLRGYGVHGRFRRQMARMVEPRRVDFKSGGADVEAWYYQMDTDAIKDWLAAELGRRLEDEITEAWELNPIDDDDYNRQMAAEHKVGVRPKSGGPPVERWILKHDGLPNHYLDCEVMQRGLAYVRRVELITADIIDAWRKLTPSTASPAGGLTSPDGRPYLVTER